MSKTKTIRLTKSGETNEASNSEHNEKAPPTKEQVIKSLTAKIKRVEVQLQKYNVKLAELKANLEAEKNV